MASSMANCLISSACHLLRHQSKTTGLQLPEVSPPRVTFESSCSTMYPITVSTSTGIVRYKASILNPRDGDTYLFTMNASYSESAPYSYALANCSMNDINYGIESIVGTGKIGYGGDGGPATAAKLNNPGGIAVDSAGNQYIADTYNNVIRKVNPATKYSLSLITTVVGTGKKGYTENYGKGLSAQLAFPTSLAYLPNRTGDSILIADTYNNVIRKYIIGSGQIITIAGTGIAGDIIEKKNYATLSELNFPLGVSVDQSGNIYIADSSNNQIKKVTHD